MNKAGLARAKAGLEVLGARFERDKVDPKGEPPTSAPVADLA